MTAAGKATLIVVLGIIALMAAGLYVACSANSYETQAREVRDGSRVRLELPAVHESLRAPCRPPRGIACQPPPRTTQQAVRRTLNRNGFGWAWRTFACIAYRESRWTPAYRIDTNGWPSRSLYQINDRYWSWVWRGRDWRNPVDATLAAIDVYKAAGGFSPWGGCP